MAERDDIREEIKDKIAAAEARTQVGFTELSGKIELVLKNMEGLNSRIGEIRTDVGTRLSEARSDMRGDMAENARSTRSNIWTVGIGLAALILAAVVALPVFVDFGIKIGEIKVGQELTKTAPKTP